MMKKKLRVALLCGGKSAERDVSLAGGREVARALSSDKYEMVQYDPACDLARIAQDAHRIDVAFILLHGPLGEDGTVQGFLDLLGIPYQGAGVLGSAIAMDKDLSKQLYQSAGLPVAKWVMVDAGQHVEAADLLAEVGSSAVIKPLRQGSSLGMHLASTPEALTAGLQDAFQFDRQVMVEEFIKGREITVGVIGNDELTVLPLVEIIPGAEYPFFDYRAKYQPGASKEICPAPFDEALSKQAKQYALTAHNALKLRGYSRTDMMISKDNGIFLIETNTIPGMTPTSLLPLAAAEYGLSFPQLLDWLIDLALEP